MTTYSCLQHEAWSRQPLDKVDYTGSDYPTYCRLQRSILTMESPLGTWMQRCFVLFFGFFCFGCWVSSESQDKSQSPSIGEVQFPPKSRADQNCEKTAEWRRLERRPRLGQSPILPHRSTWHSTFFIATSQKA